MTQEDKDLLLKDLCARLPYEVLCEDMEGKTRPLFGITPTQHFIVTLDNATDGTNGLKFCTIDCVKPYLRQMSSMTEEENGELWFLLTEGRTNIKLNSNGQLTTRENIELGFNYPFVCPEGSMLYVDWLNAHHFDYRGLIPKGLAIEVTEENNPYKE